MATVKIKHCFFYSCCLWIFSCSLEAKTVIFDFHGVLAETSKTEFIKKLNCFDDLFFYMVFDWHNPLKLQDHFFTLLTTCFGEQVPPNDCPFYGYGDGKKLPQIMCDWLMGIYSGPEIAARFSARLDDATSNQISRREKKIFKKLAWTMFDPTLMGKSNYPIPAGVKLLKDCVAAGNTVMLLTNFDPEGFIAVYNNEHMREIFELIPPENLIVSGFLGMMKPYENIYNYLIDYYHLNSDDCYFIDDQQENCDAALAKGIYSLRFNKNKVKEVRKELINLNVLPS